MFARNDQFIGDDWQFDLPVIYSVSQKKSPLGDLIFFIFFTNG